MNARDALDAIAARADAASEGPWDYAGQGWVRHGDASIGSDLLPEVCAAQVQDAPDGVFIAAARQDVPRMVAALRAVLDLADEVIVSPRRTNRWVHADRIVAAVESALDPS